MPMHGHTRAHSIPYARDDLKASDKGTYRKSETLTAGETLTQRKEKR